MTVSLSKQTMYWPYPTFTASLHPGFCMFLERDRIKLDSPWGAHWFHLPASGRACCLNLFWNVCQLFLQREISVLLGDGQILQVAGSQAFLRFSLGKRSVLAHLFLGLCHRNVMDTCMFCGAVFKSIVLYFVQSDTPLSDPELVRAWACSSCTYKISSYLPATGRSQSASHSFISPSPKLWVSRTALSKSMCTK